MTGISEELAFKNFRINANLNDGGKNSIRNFYTFWKAITFTFCIVCVCVCTDNTVDQFEQLFLTMETDCVSESSEPYSNDEYAWTE